MSTSGQVVALPYNKQRTSTISVMVDESILMNELCIISYIRKPSSTDSYNQIWKVRCRAPFPFWGLMSPYRTFTSTRVKLSRNTLNLIIVNSKTSHNNPRKFSQWYPTSQVKLKIVYLTTKRVRVSNHCKSWEFRFHWQLSRLIFIISFTLQSNGLRVEHIVVYASTSYISTKLTQ